MIVPVGSILSRSSRAQLSFRVTSSRHLGTAVRGPPLSNVGAHFEIFLNTLRRPSQDYLEFHQKCTSARVFVFWGLVATLSTLLVVDPPRSCYWTNWNVWRLPGNVFSYLFRSKGPGHIFLTEKSQGEQDVPETYAYLVANRRLPHEDAKAQTLALLEKAAHH
jgi:hypothetical protein